MGSLLAAVLRRHRQLPPSLGRTISNTITSTGSITLTGSPSTITLTITAASTDAAGLVFAGAGTSTLLGAIAGPVGEAWGIDIPTDVASIHIDWAGSSAGSISFTGI